MKTYNIITLGASGSGKTVFLASMFKELAIQAENNFFLSVQDGKMRRVLNNIYTDILSPDTWPLGTRYRDISEWTFTCSVKNPHLINYSACQFTYFDYAGGRLTDMDEDDIELKDTIQRSHAILGLLDGQKILAWMSNTNRSLVSSFLDKDLPSIIRWMSDCRVPIHFVISKWDLLQNGFSLQEIQDRLLSIPQFKHLVQSKNREGSPVRLIPISSIGLGFATLQDDGTMKKIQGKSPHPFQLEVPISCVFADTLKARISELEKKRQELDKQFKKGNQNHFVSLFKWAVDIGLSLVLEEILPTKDDRFNKVILDKIDDFFFAVIGKANQGKLEKLRQERDSSIKKVESEITAVNHVIDSFLYIQEKLNCDFPENEIII